MPSLDTFVQGWNPRGRTEFDPLPHSRANALAAVLDTAAGSDTAAGFGDGDALPPLWHWVFFQEWPAQHELGRDGHPEQGQFLPPIPDRRRMFAGGRLQVLHALRLDTPTERVLSLGDVTHKNGRSGELLFVTVRGEFRQRGTICLIEEQDLVYRSGPARGAAPVLARSSELPESDEPWQQPQDSDPVRLFRFSALTANAHRIHYDAPYARDAEGYPGLVVHGPLLALWMHELARTQQPQPVPSTVSYRFHHPMFADDPALVTGRPSACGGSQLAVHGAAHHMLADMTISPGEVGGTSTGDTAVM